MVMYIHRLALDLLIYLEKKAHCTWIGRDSLGKKRSEIIRDNISSTHYYHQG